MIIKRYPSTKRNDLYGNIQTSITRVIANDGEMLSHKRNGNATKVFGLLIKAFVSSILPRNWTFSPHIPSPKRPRRSESVLAIKSLILWRGTSGYGVDCLCMSSNKFGTWSTINNVVVFAEMSLLSDYG